MSEYVRGESFPVLDANRDRANREFNRQIIAELDCVEPFIEETDSWCTMPVRLVVTDHAPGRLHLEVGPYNLDRDDVAALRAAIEVYREQNSRDCLRRIDDGGTGR